MRRVVSLILIGLLLTQGLAVPHSHAGTGAAEPAGHDQGPHLHFSLSWLFPAHSHDLEIASHDLQGHGHHHHHGHSHHHHHDDATCDDPESPVSAAEDGPIPEQQHDADAVHVADVFVADNGFRWVHDNASHSLLVCATWVFGNVLRDQVQAAHNLPPPFIHGPPCPIYLQTLALLI